MENLESSQESRETNPEWIRPNLQKEIGEIERVMREFLDEEVTGENLKKVVDILENSPLSDLSEEEWSRLENTDSFHNVRQGEIKDAESINEEYNRELSEDTKRDFGALLKSFRKGGAIEAPTILREKGILHLVSGNTRLMISRALNIRPKVIIGDISER